jgi:ribose transport system ATP-binding protein
MKNPNQIILQCKNISKKFPGVLALNDIDFECRYGEIHGLVGENGAGKSTLMKIIAGAYEKDNGKIFIDGKEVNFKNTEDAIKAKIITVFQESNIIESLRVFENIFLNHELKIHRSPFLNEKKMIKISDDLINQYGLDFKSMDKVKNLTVDEKKMIEIFRGVTQGAKLLILDEPTSSLTDLETEKVLNFLMELVKKNIGIIFITHNINEVVSISDRITVFREGKNIKTVESKETNQEEIIELMLGKHLVENLFYESFAVKDNIIFEIKGLNVKNKLHDINMQLKKGEVLGVTGLIGSGGTDLAEAIFGIGNIKKESGKFILKSKNIEIKNSISAINHGIGYLTPDRKADGLFLKFPVYDNVSIVAIKKFANKIGIINKKRQISVAKEYINMLNIKTPSASTPVESLSGGNQQKVVFAKWLEILSDVMIMNEPTIGIDVGAKIEIRKTIKNMAAKGKSIILISTEPDDLIGLCDRILVIFKGRIVNEIDGKTATKEIIIQAATKGYDKEAINA